jgi:hypothetical protein
MRKHLYGHVYLDSQRKLDLFCSTTAAKPALAALVVELKIDLGKERRAREAATGPDSGGLSLVLDFVHSLKPLAMKLSALANRLVNIRAVGLADCPSPWGEALLLDCCADALPCLEELTLYKWEPHDGRVEGRKALSAALSTFPKLHTLRLSTSHISYSILPRSGEPATACTRVQTLVLDEWCAPPDDISYDIGALFPNLLSFRTTQLQDDHPVIPLIEKLPSTLEELDIWRYQEFFGIVPVNVVPFLARFPRLSSLHLSPSTVWPEDRLQYLRSAPTIRHLGFHRGSSVPDATLFVIAALPHLKTLELDHALGHKGLPLLEEPRIGELLRQDEAQHVFADDPLNWGWEPPELPPDVTIDGIDAVVGLARSNGVEVSGTALDIPRDFDKAWRREVASIVGERFIQTGDLSWLEDTDVTLTEVLEYVGGTVRSLREELNVPPPGLPAPPAAL